MFLINGVESEYIRVHDRGFQYGDGLFETIEVINGLPVFLQQHLQRLSTGCLRLKIPDINRDQLSDECYFACKQSEHAVLKIIITRGQGGRGYRQAETVVPTRVISLYPFPEYPSSYYEEGIIARFCKTQLGLNQALAGIKHLNRLEQIMARAEWDDPAIQEGIMLDMNNHIIEGTMTNLFYVKDDVVYTSTLQLCGVNGIIRGIIKQVAAEQDLAFFEHDYKRETLMASDEVFVCNSLVGIWPVKQIESRCFSVGKLTKQLQYLLAQKKAQETK